MGALSRAWGHVFTNRLAGAYYEFGVYRGDTFRAAVAATAPFLAWQAAQRVSPEPWRRARQPITPHFYAFDTFAGMPDNAEGEPTFAAGTFACSLDEFTRRNRAVGIVEGERVRYFAGTFASVKPETIAPLEPAVIVNLDCDLEASTRDALALVAPKLVQGTVLLVDDWNAFAADPRRGQRRALADFLAAHTELAVEPWFAYHFVGQAFLVHHSRNTSM
ncbi:MAG TPA: TylF/MycF/NovP-related O-methyltransferase [Terriglobales bacterium]|nr:TylF/MycF/NovP-related O-methyltransferase [Terriglobales bacterium]